MDPSGAIIEEQIRAKCTIEWGYHGLLGVPCLAAICASKAKVECAQANGTSFPSV